MSCVSEHKKRKKLSLEYRREKSEAMKKKYEEGFIHPMIGRENKWGKHTEETKIKMSENRVFTKEWRDNLRKSHLEYYKNHPEAIEKIRKHRAKQVFPLEDTKIELKVQSFLKELHIDFFSHHYIDNIEHGYQCDIYIPSMNLVVECDGVYWHNYPTGRILITLELPN